MVVSSAERKSYHASNLVHVFAHEIVGHSDLESIALQKRDQIYERRRTSEDSTNHVPFDDWSRQLSVDKGSPGRKKNRRHYKGTTSGRHVHLLSSETIWSNVVAVDVDGLFDNTTITEGRGCQGKEKEERKGEHTGGTMRNRRTKEYLRTPTDSVPILLRQRSNPELNEVALGRPRSKPPVQVAPASPRRVRSKAEKKFTNGEKTSLFADPFDTGCQNSKNGAVSHYPNGDPLNFATNLLQHKINFCIQSPVPSWNSGPLRVTG